MDWSTATDAVAAAGAADAAGLAPSVTAVVLAPTASATSPASRRRPRGRVEARPKTRDGLVT
jgi:hypothetical protein